MAKPTKIKVGAHTYKVSYQPGVLSNSDNATRTGECDFKSTKMTITTHMPNEQPLASTQLAETFLHELVHAVSHDRSADLEEYQVERMSAGLNAAIHDNPEIFGTTFARRWRASKKSD